MASTSPHRSDGHEGGLLTPREVCSRLRVSRQTLANWVTAGHLYPVLLPGGGHRRYRVEDIEAIERGEVPA